MNYIQQIEHWGDVHHPKWLDIIRIILGAFLCYKGFDFLRNMSSLLALMSAKAPFSTFNVVMVAQYVAYAQLVGGILLMLGLFTRFACLMQIPILLGAVIFINSARNAVLHPYSELYLSIIILVLLVYFLIAGNGPWALRIKNQERKEKNDHPGFF